MPIAYSYDALGRRLTESFNGYIKTSGYDAAGRRISLTLPGSVLTIAYDYDTAGYMTAVRENGATSGLGVLATYGYDSLGRRTSITRGNGTVTSYGYDAVGRLANFGQDLAGTTNDLSLTGIAYNPASQQSQQTRSNDSYAWSGHYNIARSYMTNGLNQLTSAGAVALGYDGRGNLTSSGTTTFSYTSENRMALSQVAGQTGVTMNYDLAGRLWQLTGTSAVTRFDYDGANLIMETDNVGNILRRYVPGAGTDEPLVWYEGAGFADKRWLHNDERGSIIAISNTAGTAIALNRYDEFGIPLSTNMGRFGYTGQTWLEEVGLNYYKARMYSPTLGRFMQTDPVGYKDGINWYAYVANDPVDGRDPSGLRTLTEGEQEMAAALGLSLPYYQIYSIPKPIMDIGRAAATTFPWEMDYSSEFFRKDFSHSLEQRALFNHELFHLFQNKTGIKPFLGQAAGQILNSVNYSWNSKLPWAKQNFEAQARAFGQCAGAGAGCSRLEGQSVGGNGSKLSFSKGIFTLTTAETGSRIPQVTTFQAPVNRDDKQ